MAADCPNLDKQPRDGELAALERRCFERPWSAADYARLRSNPMVSAWILRGSGFVRSGAVQSGVLKSAGAPHAFVCFQLVAAELEIFRIGVVPQHRKTGQARRLLRKVLEYARQEGAMNVYLEVRAGNAAARRLYESAGFLRVGARESYFQHPREDALIFGLTTGGLSR